MISALASRTLRRRLLTRRAPPPICRVSTAFAHASAVSFGSTAAANVHFVFHYGEQNLEYFAGLTCTIGLKSEPAVDNLGRVQRCVRTVDCADGYMCDVMQRICCKGANRCPKDYVETGRLCETNDSCGDAENEVCVRARKGKQRICCRLEQLAAAKV